MNDIEFEIGADDSKARQAFERTNSTIDRMEKMASSAAEKMTRVFDAVAKALFKIAEAAGAVYLLKRSWEGLTASTEALLNLYRSARILLSPTLFTAASLGVGILVEQTLKLVYAEGELIEKQALVAVRTKQNIADIQALGQVSREASIHTDVLTKALAKINENSSRVADLGVVGGSGIGQRGKLLVLSDVIRQLDAIEDPVKRAEQNLKVFGDEVGEQIFPRISARLADTIERMQTFTDPKSSTNIDRLKRDIDKLGDSFGSLGDKISAAWHQLTYWVSATAASAYVGVKDNFPTQETLRGGGLIPFGTAGGVGAPLNADAIMTRGGVAALERFSIPSGYQGATGSISAASARMNANSSTLEGQQANLAFWQSRRDLYARQAAGAVDSAGKGVASDLYLQADAEVQKLTSIVDALEKAKAKADDVRRRTEQWPGQVQELMRRQSLESAKQGQEKWQQNFNKFIGEDPGGIENRMRGEAALAAQQAKVFDEAEKAYIDSLRKREDAELDHLGVSKDHQLAQLETVNAYTVKQKIALEQRKAQIETDYLNQRMEKEIELLKRRTELEIQDKSKGIQDQIQLDAIRFQYEAALEQKIAVLRGQTADKVAQVQDQAAVRSAEFQRSENQKTVDAFERGFEGLFDAVFTRAHSFASALKDLFFAVVLTPLKVGLAQSLAQGLFGGGGNASGASSGGGFSLNRIFGGFGGGNPASAIGPGGTSGFAGPLGSLGGGGGGGGLKGIFSGGASGLGALPGLLALGGTAGAMWGFGQESAGHSTAMRALGAGATFAGATLAGGAIGMMVGGPLGAIIGLGIGAAVGTVAAIVGFFRKSAAEKAKEKIKSVYGITMEDKGILSQIVQLANQSFGGNLDVAIRSPQVRDLIQLYAMTTGQQARAGSMPAMMQSFTYSQSGGNLNYVPNYSNGSALPPNSAPIVNGYSQGQSITVVMDHGATTDVLERGVGRGIVANPQAVAMASQSANALNIGRRQQAAQFLRPGLVTS